MKFETIYNLIYQKIIFVSLFYRFFFKKIFIFKFINACRSWKISKFADSYWFLFSNKKVLFELRAFALI